MGGWGSGWTGPRKLTVEECATLNLLRLGPLLEAGPGYGTDLEWHNRFGETTTSIRVVMVGSAEDPALELRYSQLRGDERHDVRDRIGLTYSVLRWGGRCPYMLCPGCYRRVRTLHLPPRRRLFRCRHCYRLTYASCQDSHKYESMFRGIAADMDLGIDGDTLARLMRRRFA